MLKNYQKFLEEYKRDIVLKNFWVTPEKFFVEILCDGKHYSMECKNEPEVSGEWFPDNTKDGDILPKDCPDFGDIIYYNDEFIYIVVDNNPLCFTTKTYEPVKIELKYLYEVIYVNGKTYVLVNHMKPELYEAKKIWERESQLFFVDAKDRLFHGYLYATKDNTYFRGSIADEIDGFYVNFRVEQIDDLPEKLIKMKKEACG